MTICPAQCENQGPAGSGSLDGTSVPMILLTVNLLPPGKEKVLGGGTKSPQVI